MRTLLLLCLLLVFGLADKATKDDYRIRQLSTGDLQGRQITTKDDKVIFAYLGIPYANAPIGDLRFKAPEKKLKWEGVLDATEYKVSCPYNSSFLSDDRESKFMSEDCLQTNVFTSARCLKEGNCPVLVYLFPSELYFGSSVMIEARRIAEDWAAEDVVVVTFNHRLGVFGLLNLGTDTSTDASDDAVLLDQIAALEWTQKHISMFGADTRHVTLMSVGSGASNADLLALSPKTKKLFNQLVLIDGAASLYNNSSPDTNERSSKNIAIKIGCSTIAAWGKKDKADTTLKCLREHRAKDLLDVQRQLEDYLERIPFTGPPVNPSGVLTKKVTELQRNRRAMPLLLGNTGRLKSNRKEHEEEEKKDDGTSYCAKAANFKNLYLSKRLLKECKKLYKRDQEAAFDEVTVNLPLLETSRLNTKQGGKTYLFETESEFDENLHLTSKTENEHLKKMILRFVKTGDPSGENDKIQWKPFELNEGNYVKLSGDAVENAKGYHEKSDDFWNNKSFETMPSTEEEEHQKTDEDEKEEESKEREEQKEEEQKEEGKKERPEKKEEGEKKHDDEKWKVRNMTKEEVLEFVDEMQTSIRDLRHRLKSDEEGFSEWKGDIEETLKKLNERMRHMKTHTPTRKSTHRRERHSREHETRFDQEHEKQHEQTVGRWKIRGGKLVEVKGKEREQVLRQVAAIEKDLEDIFEDFGIDSPFRRDFGAQNAQPTLLPGNLTAPTVPSVVVYRDAGWNLWFWIVFALFIVLLVLLLVTCFFLVTQKQKKGEYSQIS